jgi:hypothetical protein
MSVQTVTKFTGLLLLGSVLELLPAAPVYADSALTLISTQTASSSASLQFTNLPTSYNTLFLNCAGLLMSSNTVVPKLQIGEGAGPTWETAEKYAQEAFFVFGAGSSGSCGGHAKDNLFYCNGDIKTSATNPYSF